MFSLHRPSEQTPPPGPRPVTALCPSHQASGLIGSCGEQGQPWAFNLKSAPLELCIVVHVNGGDVASVLFNRSSCRGWRRWLEVGLWCDSFASQTKLCFQGVTCARNSSQWGNKILFYEDCELRLWPKHL